MENEKEPQIRLELAMDKYMKIGNEKYSDEYIKEAHNHTFKNYEEILRSKVCTCMYCGYQFKPEKQNKELCFTTERDGSKTLLCSMCSIDCVLGGIPLI